MRTVAVNLAGVAEAPAMGTTPYRIDVDGHPYVPVGDGGIVLGVALGDLVTLGFWNQFSTRSHIS